jgi:hypothetical protein
MLPSVMSSSRVKYKGYAEKKNNGSIHVFDLGGDSCKQNGRKGLLSGMIIAVSSMSSVPTPSDLVVVDLTDPAELVAAARAGHMVTTVVLLDSDAALGAWLGGPVDFGY